MILAALVADAVFGDPDSLWARLPHPVVIMGRTIAALDRTLNDGAARRLKGVAAILVLAAAAAAVGWMLHALLVDVTAGWLIEGLLASTLVAQKSLLEHVRAVSAPLAAGELYAARNALGKIVGRDTAELDEAGVARAAIESLAESSADGIVAPIFWGVLLGLPGMLVYKLVNTADSMIGHRDARYAEFGWAAARLDDLLNLVPARLTALLIALAAGRDRARSLHIAWRDGDKHASPNAGYPEAAMAGALDISLGGPRSYEGELHGTPWLGDGTNAATAGDLRRAEILFVRMCVFHGSLILALWAWLSP